MATLPAEGYLENSSRTAGEMKTAFDAMRDVIEQNVGGRDKETLALVSGAVTPTRARVDLTPESGTTDDLDNLGQTNLPDGSLAILGVGTTTDTITIKNDIGATGRLLTHDGNDHALTGRARIVFEREGTAWREVFRFDPAGIVGLPEETTPAANDVMLLYDVSAGAQKHVQFSNVGGGATDAEIDVLRQNIAILAFRVAVNGGLSQFSMQDGFVDEFEDETGINTGASSNQTYDAANDYYHNAPTLADIDLSGATATGDSTGGGAAGNVIDTNTTTFWDNAVANAGWLKVDFGVSNTEVAKGYKITPHTTGTTAAPKDWTFEGSNDDTNWDTLDTRSGEVTVDNTEYAYTFDNTTAYRYYRFNFTATQVGGQGGGLREMTIQENGTVSNMTLISNAVVAEAQPDTAYVVALLDPVDVVTLDTDLVISVTRDNGTTYTAATLTDEGEFSSTVNILVAEVDISAQPTGTQMIAKAVSANGKELRLHGWALLWA